MRLLLSLVIALAAVTLVSECDAVKADGINFHDAMNALNPMSPSFTRNLARTSMPARAVKFATSTIAASFRHAPGQRDVQQAVSQLSSSLKMYGLNNVIAKMAADLQGDAFEKGVALAKYIARRERFKASSNNPCAKGSLPCINRSEYCFESDSEPEYFAPMRLNSAGGRCKLKPENFCDEKHKCPSHLVCSSDSDDPHGECVDPQTPLDLPTFLRATKESKKTIVQTGIMVSPTKTVKAMSQMELAQMNNPSEVNQATTRYKIACHTRHGYGAKMAFNVPFRGVSERLIQDTTEARASPSIPRCGDGPCDNPAIRDRFSENDILDVPIRFHLPKDSTVKVDQFKTTVLELVDLFKKWKINLHVQIIQVDNPALHGKKIAKPGDLDDPEYCIQPEDYTNLDVPQSPDCIVYNEWATILHPSWIYDQVVHVFVGKFAKPNRLGFAKYPWSGAEHGLIFLNDKIIGAASGEKYAYTFAHELGHVFGLLHTHKGRFDENGCGTCGENYGQTDKARDTTGDFCSDTPVTPRNLKCVEPVGTDVCTSRPWANTGFKNLMGYAKGCRDELTRMQNRRARCWAYNGSRHITKCRSPRGKDGLYTGCTSRMRNTIIPDTASRSVTFGDQAGARGFRS